MALASTLLHTAKTCTRVFHEIEYIIRITSDDNGLTVELEQKNTAEMWRSTFNQSFVEEISRRAGNQKSFPVFLKMLHSAIDEDSSAVHVDILTRRDLDMLRQRQDLKPPNITHTTDNSNKRYFILTYQAEFDKVHYPLALAAVEIESKESLRSLIAQLRLQLERGVKSEQTEYLTKENEQLRKRNDDLQADLHACEQRLAEANRYNSGGADTRRECSELRLSKQKLSRYENELHALKEIKSRLVVDHRKELELVRRELAASKTEVRRLQAQARRGTSPAAATRGISPGVRSVRSRPLSASSASSDRSDWSRPSSIGNRPPSSTRYDRARGNALPTVPSHRVSPNTRAQRRGGSPSNSYNSFRPNPSPRRSADLPPRRGQSPADRSRRNSPAMMDRGMSPTDRDGRPLSPSRRGAPELSRQYPAPALARPPPSRRNSPTPSYGSADRGKRQTSRSLSPSMKTYVSPYAQTSRISPQRRGSGSNNNSFAYEERSPGILPKPPPSQRGQSPVRGLVHNNNQRRTSREREREPERRDVATHTQNNARVSREQEVVEPRDTQQQQRHEDVYNTADRGRGYANEGAEVRTSPRRGCEGPSTSTTTRERERVEEKRPINIDTSSCQEQPSGLPAQNQPLPASPVRMRAGPDIAPAVSDIDARLTALQNFLRNNQTIDA